MHLPLTDTAYVWPSGAPGSSAQLGTGDESRRSAPVLVRALRRHHVSSIACGPASSAAVTEQGVLWTWGQWQAKNWPTEFQVGEL
jgi:alpha-tubulin suppressor-like RCC1 family protein